MMCTVQCIECKKLSFKNKSVYSENAILTILKQCNNPNALLKVCFVCQHIPEFSIHCSRTDRIGQDFQNYNSEPFVPVLFSQNKSSSFHSFHTFILISKANEIASFSSANPVFWVNRVNRYLCKGTKKFTVWEGFLDHDP